MSVAVEAEKREDCLRRRSMKVVCEGPKAEVRHRC